MPGQEIEKLEWIFYAESSYGVEDAKQIVFLARKLADEMREWESRILMLSYVGEVRDFATWVERRSRSGFDDAALRDSRLEWECLRARVFNPEPWFLSE